jgi:hypothetical protein
MAEHTKHGAKNEPNMALCGSLQSSLHHPAMTRLVYGPQIHVTTFPSASRDMLSPCVSVPFSQAPLAAQEEDQYMCSARGASINGTERHEDDMSSLIEHDVVGCAWHCCPEHDAP